MLFRSRNQCQNTTRSATTASSMNEAEACIRRRNETTDLPEVAGDEADKPGLLVVAAMAHKRNKEIRQSRHTEASIDRTCTEGHEESMRRRRSDLIWGRPATASRSLASFSSAIVAARCVRVCGGKRGRCVGRGGSTEVGEGGEAGYLYKEENRKINGGWGRARS